MDAKHQLADPAVYISRAALLHNVAVVREALSENTKICAIVKADAYGHGSEIIVDALTNFSHEGAEAPAVDALAVASIDEASALPANNLPVLVLRPIENAFLGHQRAAIEHAVKSGWVLTLCSPAAANDVARIAQNVGKRASVQIMVDTGMRRSGVNLDHLDELILRIESHLSLRLSGLGTHFATSEEPENPLNEEQLKRFRESTDLFVRDAERTIKRHAANSGAIFFLKDSHLDMVRPGISLYGIDPTGKPNIDRPLRPVLKWTAPLIGIREVKRGAAVGYGQTWHAKHDSRIGLVPIGYADGYLRRFSNKAAMIVHGRPCNVAGNVSMDMTTIDLTEAPNARVGDEVTILDNDPLSPVSAYALAKWAETIPYEIISRIGPRVRRVPVNPTDSHVRPPSNLASADGSVQ